MRRGQSGTGPKRQQRERARSSVGYGVVRKRGTHTKRGRPPPSPCFRSCIWTRRACSPNRRLSWVLYRSGSRHNHQWEEQLQAKLLRVRGGNGRSPPLALADACCCCCCCCCSDDTFESIDLEVVACLLADCLPLFYICRNTTGCAASDLAISIMPPPPPLHSTPGLVTSIPSSSASRSYTQVISSQAARQGLLLFSTFLLLIDRSIRSIGCLLLEDAVGEPAPSRQGSGGQHGRRHQQRRLGRFCQRPPAHQCGECGRGEPGSLHDPRHAPAAAPARHDGLRGH
jgi:hypothetical protein